MPSNTPDDLKIEVAVDAVLKLRGWPAMPVTLTAHSSYGWLPGVVWAATDPDFCDDALALERVRSQFYGVSCWLPVAGCEKGTGVLFLSAAPFFAALARAITWQSLPAIFRR